ncbi:mitogen-activated protein kinase kinase kinase 20-like [Cornus florida]|uniref:mitogen-activated protein kinase kinase kinase 20-like n=1 Tax=Cornus florida TaxID=4283 RepID=UPI002897E752|nr:mitogen-activated protein kinase kinase kinase 20-like [Cornus florida]
MEREIRWKRGRRLGMGSFGVVSLAEAYDEGRCNSPLLMAMKTAPLSLSCSLRKERDLLRELEGCPYVLRCFGDEVSTENGVELYNIMLEYASGGSLGDCIQSSGKGLAEYEVRRYTKNMLMGLSYIHEQCYVHCDIKPHNILLVGEEDSASLINPKLKRVENTAKIADFGLAMKIEEKRSPKLRGTPMYLAPESVRHQEYQPPSDIWALGCTVLELITGTTPWHCEPHAETCALLYRIGLGKTLPEIPSWVSAEAKDFLKKCLVHDPKSRWSADMLLGHPFVLTMDNTPKDAKELRSCADHQFRVHHLIF